MNPLLWIALLLLVGLAMMVLEVFVPSGGVLGFLSVVAMIAAIVTAFVEQGATLGMAVLATTFVAVPAALGMAFRWFPQTPLGRRVPRMWCPMRPAGAGFATFWGAVAPRPATCSRGAAWRSTVSPSTQ
jgi:hypothetical protein